MKTIYFSGVWLAIFLSCAAYVLGPLQAKSMGATPPLILLFLLLVYGGGVVRWLVSALKDMRLGRTIIASLIGFVIAPLFSSWL